MEFEYEDMELVKFLWYLPWDAQRTGFRYHPEFTDYATIAIGLYAAAAGISRETILALQNSAAINNRFAKNTKYDDRYTFLPVKNVRNTDQGFDLYMSGRVRPAFGNSIDKQQQ